LDQDREKAQLQLRRERLDLDREVYQFELRKRGVGDIEQI